jgi:hypothetical protein
MIAVIASTANAEEAAQAIEALAQTMRASVERSYAEYHEMRRSRQN